MNLSATAVRTSAPGVAARQRLLAHRGEPLLLADWVRVLMLHFEVDPRALQRDVPYPLDLWEGRAFVSVVAFTMRDMRPALGGRWSAWLLRPIATHDFLNVRTYVRHDGEAGHYFLAEWLSNRLAVALGPRTFGLPYRHGRIRYHHDAALPRLSGCVADVRSGARFEYRLADAAAAPMTFAPCAEESPDEWLMERYTAFNSACGARKFFRIWHPPWPQQRVEMEVRDRALLEEHWDWFATAELAFANYSPGAHGVLMGRPHSLKR